MAWIRILGGRVVQQGTDGRHGIGGPRAEVADRGEERRPDRGVRVGQAGGQLLRRPRGQRADLSQGQGRTPTDAGLAALRPPRVSNPTTGRPIWASASAIGSIRLPSRRRASSSAGPRPGPIFAEQERGVSRDARRLRPSAAPRAPAPGGASKVGRSTSRSTTASRTRSSWSPEVLLDDRQQGVVRQRRASTATRRRPPGPPGRRHARTRRTARHDPVVRRGADDPRASTAPARTMTSWSAEAAIKRLDRGRADPPERARGFAPDPLALVPEQGDQVGDGGRRVGPDPPQGHDDLGPHVLLLLLQQAAQPLDGGLADGRERQGRSIILVRLLLPLAAVIGPQGVDQARGRPARRRARAP